MFKLVKQLCYGLLLILIFSAQSSYAQSHLVDRPKRNLFSALKITALSTDTRELAEQLEILPLLSELYNPKQTTTDAQKALLREKILETILESYFDASSVQAESEREEGRLEALRETLMTRRDRAVGLNNATNFIASGALNTVGSILGFSSKMPPFPGNLNQMLSGVVSSGMSTYSLKQSNGGSTRGQGYPTVLAELFGRPTDERTVYPESVWRFFHGKVPSQSGMTRIQLLENTWINRHELESHGSPRESLKIDLVCGVTTARRSMTINDLTDQINMINDVSTLAGFMTHHLRDLLRMIDSDVLRLSPE